MHPEPAHSVCDVAREIHEALRLVPLVGGDGIGLGLVPLRRPFSRRHRRQHRPSSETGRAARSGRWVEDHPADWSSTGRLGSLAVEKSTGGRLGPDCAVPGRGRQVRRAAWGHSTSPRTETKHFCRRSRSDRSSRQAGEVCRGEDGLDKEGIPPWSSDLRSVT